MPPPHPLSGNELITCNEMATIDRRAVELGIAGLVLMENAGHAVAEQARRMTMPGAAIAVVCGPGNNGGDGFVAARLLSDAGYTVHLALLGEPDRLRGDAALVAAKWTGGCSILTSQWLEGIFATSPALIIDALFGAGLTRPLEGETAAIVGAINAAAHRPNGPQVLAVDVPSGLDGTTGQVCSGGSTPETAVEADHTVTFHRLKPGHLLMPGRILCGELHCAGIGIPDAALDAVAAQTAHNNPDLWLGAWPRLALASHKYTRGHALVVSGPLQRTGAARLAACAALRAGAGLVTLASPPGALMVNACHLTAVMLLPFADSDALAGILADKRKNAALIGPGCGVGAETRANVEAILRTPAHAVLDADALTSFATDPESLFAGIRADAGGMRGVVLTPHEGEFARIFPHDTDAPSKLDRARRAAKRSGAVIVLKGPDTVIAAPDGRAAINTNAPPWLATAGSGDTLAGLITGLLAQGVPAWEAACAGVWLHGECGNRLGRGLIAEDLAEALPGVLQALPQPPARG
ncbi:MAG TPA: NAD(P)H-hydrate dehydratase [Hyphomicrobiaceae bacterium]|nr:NAD(P)H-hydrate dehydratase [Hyphomicrobiaceae bacterium]